MRGKPPTIHDIRREIRYLMRLPVRPPWLPARMPRAKPKQVVRPKGLPQGIDYTSAGRYRARIWLGGAEGGYVSLGIYDSLEEAVGVYQERKALLRKGALPTGVYRHGSRYQAYYTRNGRRHHLGTFPTPEEASAAYQRAKLEVLTMQTRGSSLPQSE